MARPWRRDKQGFIWLDGVRHDPLPPPVATMPAAGSAVKVKPSRRRVWIGVATAVLGLGVIGAISDQGGTSRVVTRDATAPTEAPPPIPTAPPESTTTSSIAPTTVPTTTAPTTTTTVATKVATTPPPPTTVATTTTTVAAEVESVAEFPSTTEPAPATTRRSVPATTAAPAPTAGGCHPSYDPCVPIASDVDCAGGGGNGPEFVDGPVRVIGPDKYGLDRDNDGIGCE